MTKQVVTAENIERLIEHMFDQVLSESERADLLEWIRSWEAENPGVDAAHRVTGWIDVAYAFQATKIGRQYSPASPRESTTTAWGFQPSFA